MSSQNKPEQKKADNDIRIGMNTRPRNVIKYATSILSEKKLTELKFSAVGGSIGRLVDTVEVLKITIPGFYQQNRLSSVTYQTVDSNQKVVKQRLYPKLEVILTKEEPKVKNEGTQEVMNEEERQKIEKFMKERKEKMEKEFKERGPRRGVFRGNRRGFRGRGRGFRGRGFRGQRGRGNFGGRGPRRGGPFRGNRGDKRGRGSGPRGKN